MMKLLIAVALVFCLQQDTIRVKGDSVVIVLKQEAMMNRQLNKMWDMNTKLDSIIKKIEKRNGETNNDTIPKL